MPDGNIRHVCFPPGRTALPVEFYNFVHPLSVNQVLTCRQAVKPENLTRYLLISIVCMLLLLAGSSASAQTTVTGTVSNAATNAPLKRVNISVPNTKRGTITNSRGEFRIKVRSDRKSWLKFSYLGYRKDSVLIEPGKGTEQVVNIRLEQEAQILEGFTVTDKPEEVFGSIAFSVADFAFGHDNRLVMLAYDKGLKKDARIVLAERDQTVLEELPISGEAVDLFSDYLDRVHILCENKVYQVREETGRNSLALIKLPEQDFYSYLYPIIDTLRSHLLWSDYRWRFPQFNYFALNQADTTIDTLATVVDRALMRQYRFNYYYLHPRDKLLARKVAMNSDADKFEIAAEMSKFPESLYYEPVYAPLFVHNDTVRLFDHYSNRLYVFDGERHLVDSVDITYHNDKTPGKWKREIVEDEDNGNLYARFEHKGHPYLKRIDVKTGKASEVIKLTHKYVEKVRVKDDYVYYIYRPTGSLQQKFLYRELIKRG